MSATHSPSAEVRLPFWATPRGVWLCLGLYCLVFIILAWPLASGINVDDMSDSYESQVLQIVYSPRNPPMFEWLIFSVQKLIGAGRASFVLVRYGLLFATATLIYAIARQTIRDPRLQALAVFSLSLCWLIGYHSHRIITHSNVMIVAIAASFLVLLKLKDEPTPWRYVLLGVWVMIGVIGKFGYAAFAGFIFLAALFVADYRRVVLSPKILLTVVTAAIPLATFFVLGTLYGEQFGSAVYNVVGPDTRSTLVANISAFAVGVGGYLLPFIAIFALVFWPRLDEMLARFRASATVRLIFYLCIIGTIASLATALAGSPNIRDRYFHVSYLFASVMAFALIDGAPVTAPRIRVYLNIIVVSAALIALVFLAQRLAPAVWLCRECSQSAPYTTLGNMLAERYEPMPTLITDMPTIAGQIHAGMPGARLIAARDPEPPIVKSPGQQCLLIWPLDALVVLPLSDAFKSIAHDAGVDLDKPDVLAVPWWAPLLPQGRVSHWAVLKLPPETPACR